MTASPIRDQLRAQLTEALRARDKELAGALRSTIGALDNAEAVPGETSPVPASSSYVAGAHTGLGAAEAERRVLSAAEEREVVRRESEDLRVASRQYADNGHGERAAAAVRAAEALERVLGG